jgi:ATP-dependent Clp protease ATP-binding subunit ClpA
VFERFTERARQVVVLAQDESRGLGHDWIGTEHLLLGVLREEGLASEALAAGGLSLERARKCVEAIVGELPSRGVTGQIPFTREAKRALENARDESNHLGGREITPELVLVGVMRERSGGAACVLRDCRVDIAKVVSALALDPDADPTDFLPAPGAKPERTTSSIGESVTAESGSGGFARFTERARQVLVLAQDESRAFRHSHVGTEHILLGLLREEEGLAARVLESLDITAEEVRAQVARIVGQGDKVTTGHIPFTPRAKKVLELALREALSLGHNYIGTEHILLGLVRENEGVAARILLDFDADAEKIRNEIIRMLSGPGRRHQPHPDPRAIRAPVWELTLGEVIKALRRAKDAAIERQQFEPAAGFRDAERRVTRLALELEALLELRKDDPAGPDAGN